MSLPRQSQLMPWYRIGNFYKQFEKLQPNSMDAVASHFVCHGDGLAISDGLDGGYLVVFRNSSRACIISQIVACDHSKTKGQLNYELLVSDVNNVAEIARILRSTNNSIYVKNRSITIRYPEATDPEATFFNALRMIDAKYNVNEFTSALKIELYNIYCFATDEISEILGPPQNLYRHIILKRKVERYSHFNPYQHRSKRFQEVFNKKVVDMRKLKYLLLTGEDPNSCSEYDLPPILYAMMHHDEWVLGLLLLYGADPFFRRDFGISGHGPFGNEKFVNAIEYGIQHKLFSKVDIIVRHLSYIEKSLTPAPGERAIVTMTGNHTNTTTLFEYRFKTITTVLKPAEQLTPEERAALLQQYQICFETNKPDSDATVNRVFSEDFAGSGKLVECIYMTNKAGKDKNTTLIGLNLFELLLSKVESNLIYVHCICSLVDPIARGQGLMAMLLFRIAFALQQILSDYRVGVYYASLTHDGWGMIKDILHFPKYQTHFVTQNVHEILKKNYGEKLDFTHDLMTCYVKESVRVKSDFMKKFDDNNLFIKFFYREFLNLPVGKWNNEELRAVPVFFYVGDESQALLEKKAALMGIDFSQHTLSLANYLLTLLVDMLKITDPNPQPAAVSRSLNSLFYKNKVEPGIPSDGKPAAPNIPRSTL